MNRDDQIRIRHMIEAARQAIQVVSGKSRHDLDADRFLVLGLMKCLEIIGEAASRLTTETRAHYPQIPWPQIVGMRNRLIHAYFDINLDLMWNTLDQDLPYLVRALEEIPGIEGDESDVVSPEP